MEKSNRMQWYCKP